MSNISDTSPWRGRNADSTLWVYVALTGLALTLACLAATAVWGWTPLWQIAHDTSLLGFMLPACIAIGIWLNGSPLKLPQLHVSEAAQLLCAAYIALAAGLAFAQCLIGRAWLTGYWPLSVTLSVGTAALSPLFISRVRPQWLRRESNR